MVFRYWLFSQKDLDVCLDWEYASATPKAVCNVSKVQDNSFLEDAKSIEVE